MRTKENSEEARKTLQGIVRLVAKIKEMKVGEGVRGKVLGAVERLERVSEGVAIYRSCPLAISKALLPLIGLMKRLYADDSSIERQTSAKRSSYPATPSDSPMKLSSIRQ